jgi:excisionase family DNA binding protein
MKSNKFAQMLVGPDVIKDHLKVSRNTVLNWANSGAIPAIKIGRTYRFSLKEVSKVIKFPLDEAV